MAFAICSFILAFSPSLIAFAATSYTFSEYSMAINAVKIPNKEVNVGEGDKFLVPLLAETFSEDYTIRVIDPAGGNHDYVHGASTQAEPNFFGIKKDDDSIEYVTTIDGVKYVNVNAQNEGEYKIVYIVSTTEGSGENAVVRKYYSNTYRVTVSNLSYELDFTKADGSKQLVANQLKTSTDRYVIPTAYFKTVDGTTDRVNNIVVPKVTKNNVKQELNGANSIFKYDSEKKEYYIIPSESGQYTVEYTYEGANRPEKTFTISVKDNFVQPTKLTLASTPTKPTLSLGKKGIELRELTFNTDIEDNVAINTDSIKIEKEGDSSIYQTLTNNTFTFDMTASKFHADSYDEMTGNYRITYTVRDAYGNTKTETLYVDGVTVTGTPESYISYDYAKTDTVAPEDYATELKTKYGSDNIVLPAIYGSDSVASYNDLIFVRYLKRGNTYYYIDNKRYDEDTHTLVDVANTEEGYNHSGDQNIGDWTKAVEFKFTADPNQQSNYAGTYTLEYRAIAKTVKERTGYAYVPGTKTSYTITVSADPITLPTEAEEIAEITPTVEISNLKDGYVKTDEPITVSMTYSDKEDTRLKTVMFYHTGNVANMATNIKDTIKDLLDTHDNKSHIVNTQAFRDAMATLGYTGIKELGLAENSTDSYVLDLTEETATKVYVTAVAINDYGYVAADTKALDIKSTAEKIAPDYSIEYVQDTDGLTNDFLDGTDKLIDLKDFDQAVKVQLPNVVFTDADPSLKLNVMYYIDSPENAKSGLQYKYPTGKSYNGNTIKGGYIETSEVGVYYIAYSATDAAGNTTVVYFRLNVVDSSNPSLSVDVVGDNLSRTGSVVTAEIGSVIDFETALRSSDGKTELTAKGGTVSIVVEDDGTGLDYQTSGYDANSYIFNSVGMYKVTVTGEYNGRKTVKELTINVKAPELKWLNDFEVKPNADKNAEVILPNAVASHDAIVTVSVKAPSGNVPTAGNAVRKTNEDGLVYWSFTTNEYSKGTYTVTYTATTEYAQITKTFSIKVGDNTPPVFAVGEETKLANEIVYDGTNDIEVVLNVNKSKKTFVITATSNGKELYSYDIGLNISDKDDSTITNDNMSWTNLSYELVGDNVTAGETTGQYFISGAGKVALKLTVKDTYENETTERYEFNVVSKAQAKENNDALVGTILIIVSLVLLAGVILYFTFTGKKGGSSNAGKKAKTEKKVVKTEEKVVVEEKVEDTAEVVEEKTEETTETVEPQAQETSDEEPKSGDVE